MEPSLAYAECLLSGLEFRTIRYQQSWYYDLCRGNDLLATIEESRSSRMTKPKVIMDGEVEGELAFAALGYYRELVRTNKA